MRDNDSAGDGGCFLDDVPSSLEFGCLGVAVELSVLLGDSAPEGLGRNFVFLEESASVALPFCFFVEGIEAATLLGCGSLTVKVAEGFLVEHGLWSFLLPSSGEKV